MLRPITTFVIVLLALVYQSNLVGQNLIQLAQRGNTEKIAEAVKADPTALDRAVGNNETMLMIALRHRQIETSKKLVELGANVDKLNNNQQNALHLAIQARNEELFDLILAANPSLNQLDRNHISPLTQAIHYQQPAMAKKLIAAGCDINLKNNGGQTPAHLAASLGQSELLGLLLENGTDVRNVDSNGTSIFMAICQSGKLDLVKEHFDATLATQVNNQGQTCLMFAIFSNNTKLIDYLCENTDLENTPDTRGNTPILLACQQHKTEVARTLLKHKANPNVQATQRYMSPPLIHAATIQNIELTKALLAADADVSIMDVRGNQALHAACGAPSFHHMGRQPRIEAAGEIVEMLLKKGADPNTKNKASQTPLALAVANSFPAGIDKLIKVTTEVDLDVGQTSLLHWACLNNMPNTVTVMLERDPTKVNESDDNGQTPLCVAATAGADEIVKMLLATDADPNLAGEDGQLPLNCSLATQSEATAMLIKAGATPSAVDGSGRSPIQAAGWHGNEKAIKLLSEQKVNLSQATQSGSTALHFAAWQGHTSAAEMLIELGVKVDVKDSDGWTPLHKAAHRGQVKMVELLLSQGADKTATDSIGLTALQKASDKKRKELEPLLK